MPNPVPPFPFPAHQPHSRNPPAFPDFKHRIPSNTNVEKPKKPTAIHMKAFDITKPIRGSLNHLAVAIAVAAGLAAGSAQVQGLTMALTGNGTNPLSATGGETDGYKFTTAAGSDVVVSWLGFYDAPNAPAGTVGDGLLASHRVSIWRESDGVLMAQTTVVPADALEGNFRGHTITPVTLAANTAYVIAADLGYSSEGGGLPDDPTQEGSDLSGWALNGISILDPENDGRYVQPAGGGMPTNPYYVLIGPNFGYNQAPPPPLANDDFANAIELTGGGSGQTGTVASGTQTGTDNIDATLEVGEPSAAGGINTVWFKWTSPADGDLTVTTFGSTTSVSGEWDAVLGIYTGAAVGALTPLGGSPQDGEVPETMTVAVTAGTTYFIQTAGYNADVAANILLSWTFVETVAQADILAFGPGAVIGPVVANAAVITWPLPPGTNPATLAPTFTLSPGATCKVGLLTVNSGDTVNFSGGPVVFTVTAQGASPIVNDYTVTAVIGKAVLWNVAGGGDWDEATANWFEQPSGPVTTFANGDAVTFDNPAGGTINIPSAVLPLSTTVSAASGTYTFTGEPIVGAGSLTKAGAGTLTLASANTYTGATVVNGGTLESNGKSAVGGSTSFTVADGANLLLSGTTSPAWPAAAAATLTGAGTVSVPLGGIINIGFNFDMSAFTGVLDISSGMIVVTPFYSPNFVSPADGTIRVDNGTTLYLGWQGMTLNTTVELAGSADNGEGLGMLRGDNATLNGAVVLAANSSIGSAGGTFTINAVISDGGNGFGFTNVGGGTVILTTTNNYTGTTIVDNGTLQCNVPDALGSGALSINGGKVNLNYVGAKTVASLTLGGVPKTTPGTYGSVASLADFPDDTYFTTGSTGTVTLGGASGFTTWADANASGQTPDQDHDDDGVENGIEYFMGETGSSFTAMPGLDGTNTVTWTMDPAYDGTYEVQTSPDLSVWTNVAPKPQPSGGNLSYTLPTGLGKRFVRLLVTPTP
jgi:autotransporter-associated beta strand protein